jgi:hypothetical protein
MAAEGQLPHLECVGGSHFHLGEQRKSPRVNHTYLFKVPLPAQLFFLLPRMWEQEDDFISIIAAEFSQRGKLFTGALRRLIFNYYGLFSFSERDID